MITLSFLARLVSALMGAFAVVIIANIACSLQSYLAGWGAGLFLASNYAFIYYSHTANVDVPYLFWFTLALYFFIRAVKEERFRYIFFGALFSVFAITTKDNAIFFCAFPALIALFIVCKRRLESFANNLSRWQQIVKPLLLVIVTIIITYLFLTDIIIYYHIFAVHIQILRANSSYYDYYGYTGAFLQSGYWGLLKNIWLNLIELIGFLGLGACLLGIALAWRNQRTLHYLLLSPVLGYILFVFYAKTTIGLRFALPVIVSLSVYFGIALSYKIPTSNSINLLLRGTVAVISLLTLTRGILMDVAMLKDSRYQATEWMKNNIPQGATIGVFNIRKYLPPFPENLKVEREDQNILDEAQPEYILITSNDSLSPELKRAIASYHLLQRFKTELPMKLSGIFSVNPELLFYEIPKDRQKTGF